MSLNPIQLGILTKLNTAIEGKRYSEIQNHNIENDLFNYHLQFLVSKNLVKKENNSYSITTEGKKIMANADALGNQYELFRFSVAVIAVKEENGEKYILAQRRKRHPYFNDISTIAGKVKKGEFIEEAAARKLAEETGLITNGIKNLGVLRKVRIDEKDMVVEDTVYTICYVENPTGTLIESNEFGENMWLTFKNFFESQKNNTDLGEYDTEIYKRVEEKNFEFFYFEQKSHIKEY